MHINLLPQKVVLQIHVRKCLRQWGWICGAIAFAALGDLAWQYRRMCQEDALRSALADRVLPLQRLRDDAAAHARQTGELERDAAALRRLGSPDRSLALLAILGDAARSTKGALQIQRMNVATAPQHAVSIAAAAASNPGTTSTRASLYGTAASDLDLARFVESLRSANVFQSVELASFNQSPTDQNAHCRFHVECRWEDQP